MEAAVLHEAGGTPVHGARPDPADSDGDGRTLVRVSAAPVAPLDVLAASGTSYFGVPALPYVPGVAGVGRVVRSGTHPVGARVHVSTTAGTGAGDGTLAELVAVPDASCTVLPEGPPDDATVAALGMSAVAAWHALVVRGRLVAGERVLVLGAGGTVGQVAVQVARHVGAATVVGAARSAAGRERALALGADAAPDLDALDDLAAAGGGAYDLVLDPLGGAPATAAVGALAVGGRLVHLGSSAGPEVTVPSAVLRSRALEVLGHTNTHLGPEQVAHALLAVLAVPGVTVAHETSPLAEVGTAWRRQAGGTATARQVVLVGRGDLSRSG
ncbi:quinone oxidoreductase family protein [Aquipuribacter sp. SD81]|uniref:quinone oxidoreductase family protein n=1 Tax=Aquipuribacter sp. SD81 TaxID=3127703 RepID=UPI00301AB91B